MRKGNEGELSCLANVLMENRNGLPGRERACGDRHDRKRWGAGPTGYSRRGTLRHAERMVIGCTIGRRMNFGASLLVSMTAPCVALGQLSRLIRAYRTPKCTLSTWLFGRVFAVEAIQPRSWLQEKRSSSEWLRVTAYGGRRGARRAIQTPDAPSSPARCRRTAL